MLGPAETAAALADQGTIRIRCEYCGRRREFDEVDVSRLFADNVVKGSESLQ
jgi:molecular chaperone Hsp33